MIRTPTRAEGGITPDEKKKMDAIVEKWKAIAFRTTPIEKEKITDAIYRLYEAAGLKRPRVVIVPSPYVGRLASGIASAVWYLRKRSKSTYQATDDATDEATRKATRQATDEATYQATYQATDEATDDATWQATDDATWQATDDATDAATRQSTRQATDEATEEATRQATYEATRQATCHATDEATWQATYQAISHATRQAQNNGWLLKLIKSITPNSTEFTIGCIKLSWKLYQGGNMWASFASYAETMRDVLNLTGLDCWDKYQAWEDAAKHGGFRYMHEEFCIVSDFPETLKVNEQNQPHNDKGPSHRWRDGFEIYHLNGVRFPKELWEEVVSGAMPFEKILAIEVTDQRTQAMRYADIDKFVAHAKGELLDEYDKFTVEGEVVNYKLYKFPAGGIFNEDAYYCLFDCPSTRKKHMEGVEVSKTVPEAMAWAEEISEEDWKVRIPLVHEV